ncbi:olfactory receptor 146-like [Rana temporaria]|uniref:olfactory receptor 146-like n=1 Tax=Rana temporaria TaxID=8407 RepID=UPI001AAC991F|nr:olfactory receptor 146-like [Rana temporaria]
MITVSKNIPMGNQTIYTEFFLSGMSDLPTLQLPLFLFFLLIYLLTLIGNFLIIVLIVTDSRLHVPMYFFLGNLAGLDLCCSSVTVPQMLFDLLTRRRMRTVTACMAQVFFFMSFAGCEVFLLSTMSYDRYVAICQPLHYTQVMQWKVCVQFVSIVWCISFTNSLVHTVYALKLKFCRSQIIKNFFCDLPQLFQISCNDIHMNIMLLLLFGVFLGVVSLITILLSYVSIFNTVLKMKVKDNKTKVFSTCTSHLTVVFLFYISVVLNYFTPGFSYNFTSYKVVSVFYTVILPLLNPMIYSLRSQDFRVAFQNISRKIISNLT